MKRYPIGATEQNEPIFWHINIENKITNGHIITMDGKGKSLMMTGTTKTDVNFALKTKNLGNFALKILGIL